MERSIRRLKTRYRRISGRKNWNAYVLRYGRSAAYYEWWEQDATRRQQLVAQASRLDRTRLSRTATGDHRRPARATHALSLSSPAPAFAHFPRGALGCCCSSAFFALTEKKLTEPQPIWQEGIGSLLLLAAAHQTGFLATLGTTIQGVASSGYSSGLPLNLAVVERLVLTLLFLPVAGLARTWDLRSYTGTMLAVVTGRQRAYSQRYTERFLARLAHAGAAEPLTKGVAKWTWQLWQTGQPSSEQPTPPAIFYIDGHRKAVYSDVLVPRGPVGKLGGKILGCRELVVLHDTHGHPLLATTHRGDQHLTIGLPRMLHCYEQATGQVALLRIVVDREGVAAEFLAQLHLEGRQVITLLRSDQYESEHSFEQVGEWQPWRYNRSGQMICEVAAAHFALKRPDDAHPPVEVEVAIIRDWRKLVPVEGAGEAVDDGDW